jgi:TrmH family RNA methyltransferase
MISSTHNPRIQLVRSLLGRSKERRDTGAFIAEGVRLVEEALAVDWPFRFVLASESLSERGRILVANLQARGVDVETVADNLMQSVSETEASQGLLAVLDHFSLPIPDKPSFVLIPDSIRDPGNLGTLLRTALAAGVQAVFLSPETTDAFSPKVVRAGMGAHFQLPLASMTWDAIRARTGGLTIYLADMAADLSCWQTNFKPPLALIIGNEADGASNAARELADQQIFIPMPGKSESLNAAVAGAILMFEVVRQREEKQPLTSLRKKQ